MAVFRFMPIPHHQRERELRQLDDARTQQLEELLGFRFLQILAFSLTAIALVILPVLSILTK